MAAMSKELPLVAIVGPTASGKTAVAIELAEQLKGEIICADSRTVYRGMDIGTAKPTVAERSRVPHWGLDLIEPSQQFTVADFKKYADNKIAEIRSRGKLPFLVGGSGLYVDAVLFDYRFAERADVSRRENLEKLTLEELCEYARGKGVQLPENSKNRRYVIRAIERGNQNLKRRTTPISTSIIVGIATDSDILRQRIAQRGEQIFRSDIVEETTHLGKMYGWGHESMTGNIYPLIRSFIEEGGDIEEVKDKFTTLDWRLAKRQLTWFRSNPHIVWLGKREVTSYVKAILADI